jgi:glycosyltransferase involved in cell wall biosynthesis
MRIAVLTTIIPNTLKTGSEIATKAILSVLEELGHEVTLFAYARPMFQVTAPVESVLLATIPIESSSAPLSHTLRWACRSLRTGNPISSEKYNYVPPERLEAAIRAVGADLLIVDHVNLYPFVGGLIGAIPTGVIFHDIQAHSYAMVAETARRPWWKAIYAREARLNATLERRAGREGRFSWFLSQADADRAERELDIAGGRVLPLFFPLSPAPQPVVPVSYDVGLIGTWSWPPVRQGMSWFLDEVVPRLPRDITVAVAGSGSDALPGERITRLGLVPDARAFLAGARVAAVPTVAGTGIQIKTLELAATGTPAVSTTLGIRGLDSVPDNLRIADTPDAFASALVEAVRAPRVHDAVSGRAWNDARRRAASAMISAALAALR